MSPTRRLRPRYAAKAVAASAVLGLVAGLAAATPAQAVYVPPAGPSALVTAKPFDKTPNMLNGSVRAFAQIGNTVYAGGSFAGAVKEAFGDKREFALSWLIAYDATSGAIKTDFKPQLDNPVATLAVSPNGKLIVGGSFKKVNTNADGSGGVDRKGLVMLDPATGKIVDSFKGVSDGGVVRRAVVNGNQLYLAGAFHYINGKAHSLLARMNATTGEVDQTFKIDASERRGTLDNSVELVWALAVAPDGKTVVATGNFKKVNGLSREQVVVIDTSTATPTVADWSTQKYLAPCANTTFPFYARDVDFSDDGSYFVIGADGGIDPTDTTAFCDTISRWETKTRGSDLDATWVDRTGRDSVTSLEAADGVVYVGGHFRWLNNANGNDAKGPGGVDRFGFGALDANNGLPLAWSPTRGAPDPVPAGRTGWGPVVWEMWKGPNGLFIGQDSDYVSKVYHGRQAYFPTAGGRTVAAVNAPQNTSGFLYLGAGNGKLTKVTYAGAGIGTPAVTTQAAVTSAKAAFSLSNKLYWAKTDATATSGSTLQISTFTKGVAAAPYLSSGYNAWYKAADMTGAFYLNGRMYYTTSTGNELYYRYFEPDGSVIGCTQFTLPTTGIDWRTVRGLTWVAGKIVYGSTDGKLRTLAFDPAAATAVNGASPRVIASGTTTANWNNPTLFFAAS